MWIAKFICDIFELTAVFLLSVEAIKLNNLQWLRARTDMVRGVINPEIEFVEGVPEDTPFLRRHAVDFWLLSLYIIGIVVCLFIAQAVGLFVYFLTPKGILSWIMWIIGGLFIPFICGLTIYTLAAWLLQQAINILSWIEQRTHTGIVGVLGFTFFTLQFVARRLFGL